MPLLLVAAAALCMSVLASGAAGTTSLAASAAAAAPSWFADYAAAAAGAGSLRSLTAADDANSALEHSAAAAGPGLTPSPADDLPIFDAHIHYNRDVWSLYSVDEALAILDQAGIYKAFVSSTPDEGTLQLAQRAPDRIVLDLRPYRTPSDPGTWTRDPSVVGYLEERLGLAERPYVGIGEFHLVPGDVIRDPVPCMVADLGARRGLVLHAHADAEAVEELLQVRPDIRVLWAHGGMSASPLTVRRLLELHPNLWVELALRTPDVAPGGQLNPAWAALFADYPDRFMIGTDTWIPSQWTRLPSLMGEVRAWLRQLPPELALAVAYGNAERVLVAQPPP